MLCDKCQRPIRIGEPYYKAKGKKTFVNGETGKEIKNLCQRCKRKVKR